ncbi:hypothetical protein Tsubulata_003975 [Turnera subulata]|uniref:Uncharacterized protein n=1 Tax=Turnera subulata TaxID=218843 RepID=A0A9Q0GCX9_9ROSI|nr:hypothetical protein Tsubulata_003975 [Turnera subulata]
MAFALLPGSSTLLLPRCASSLHQSASFTRQIQKRSLMPTSTTIVKPSLTSVRCSISPDRIENQSLRTCKNCKTQFDPSLNHPRACRFHTAHFGGETKRKFESVYSGGTMNTPDSGQVFQYWHCCGSEDPFDPGCTAAPHSSYDD